MTHVQTVSLNVSPEVHKKINNNNKNNWNDHVIHTRKHIKSHKNTRDYGWQKTDANVISSGCSCLKYLSRYKTLSTLSLLKRLNRQDDLLSNLCPVNKLLIC